MLVIGGAGHGSFIILLANDVPFLVREGSSWLALVKDSEIVQIK